MTLLGVLELLAGIAVVALVLSDVFRSVVLPRAAQRSLRLGPVLGTSVLRGVLAWARRRPAKRHAVLGALGPLLIVIEMLIWAGLMIAGYGLMFHGLGDGLKPRGGYGDALYAAGSVFLTMGFSGQEAVSPPARLIAVAAAFSGLAVVTLVVTFLLQVQTALQRREVLVLRLRARTGPRPSGVGILLAHARLDSESPDSLRGVFAAWEEWTADVLLTHRAYPVLVYFRSTDEDCEWLAALGAVLDAAALVMVMRHKGASEHATLCHRLGCRLTLELASQFGLRAPRAPALTEEAFLEALTALRGAGYDTGSDDAAGWDAMQRLRSRHMPPLLAVTDRFGIVEPTWEAHGTVSV